MKVGILGGGQLARMLAMSSHALDIEVIFLEPSTEACAKAVATQLTGAYDDHEKLAQLAEMVDVVTYEFENVPFESVEYLATKCPVYPSANALAVAQDRLNEKTLFEELNIPVAPFVAVNNLQELEQAISTTGLPAILKTRREGYDGKGQAVLRTPQDLSNAWASIGKVPAIVEAMVSFDREISIIAARDNKGNTVTYPLSENTHVDGILNLSISQPNDKMAEAAQHYITQLLDKLDYVGVLALELFQVGNQLLANEFAPRVHNSGHWTTEGAETSQFENHMRAVCSLPLGNTASVGFSAMINCIGEMPAIENVLALPTAHYHSYSKSAREGRKVGHITLRTNTATELKKQQDLLSLRIDN